MKNQFLTFAATPPASQLYSSYSQSTNGLGLTQSSSTSQGSGLSKYAQLLAVIEEMGRDIRPTYAMGRGDRLKRLIIQAKVNFMELHQVVYENLFFSMCSKSFWFFFCCSVDFLCCSFFSKWKKLNFFPNEKIEFFSMPFFHPKISQKYIQKNVNLNIFFSLQPS